MESSPGGGPTRSLLSSFLVPRCAMSSARDSSSTSSSPPHRGSLARLDDTMESSYAIQIHLQDNLSHELVFNRHDFEFAQNLFAILDTESRGLVDKMTVREFATLRCPVFARRDEDLRRLGFDNRSDTFDEIWTSVLQSSKSSVTDENVLGVEGWLVFCRLVALAQYLEAKRRFSVRHLQQTMRHRNAPRGSEVVVVDVPPPEPPAPLSPAQLAYYEQTNKTPLPLPELDLDHSLVAAHESNRHQAMHNNHHNNRASVKISLFGSSFPSSLLTSAAASSSSSRNLEFALVCSKRTDSSLVTDDVVVRRSMEDMKWLHDTFASHKVLGGTLCGRILPPFLGGSSSGVLASHFKNDDSVLKNSIKTTGGALNKAAVVGVGRLRDAAKSFSMSFFGTSQQSHFITTGEQERATPTTLPKKTPKKSRGLSLSLPESYYNPNSPVCKARQLERYLNYLLEHPALSTSFPLNTILQVGISDFSSECCVGTFFLTLTATHSV
jgi:hypothetical protein